jgi:aldose 1-epimerase
LREGNKLGNVIINKEEEIVLRKGLDHPFLVNPHSQEPIVKLSNVASGRVLEIETDRDAVVIYTHNHIQKSATGKDRLLWMHSGIALETQQLPDAVNQKGFGSIWLEPGEHFTSTTKYKFSIME